MKMMRCKADVTIRITGTDTAETLSPGIDYDLDRELAPGFTIADAVKGREDCFEPAPPAADTK